jgi:DMSO/TMAO reductase YedYZ molybdopterin-dependent catalytic subunit
MSKDRPIIKPSLTTVSLSPENKGSPIHFLNEWITPEQFFFLRNHYSYPQTTPASFTLAFDGLVSNPGCFHYQQLLKMPSKTIVLPLECSGNKRKDFETPIFGTQWDDGAISQGRWTGVPLHYLLSIVGAKACEHEYNVVFEGHDSGKITGLDGTYPFARSLPLKVALNEDVLIAYALNGKPIPSKHGYPLRLIVPKWYAMASIKWLKKITIIDKPFDGPYEKLDYHYFPYEDSDKDGVPVTLMKVNSIIQQPLPQSTLDAGRHEIYGISWTGKGIIDKVEISFDNGQNWKKTKLRQDSSQSYSWTFWNYIWDVKKEGKYTIMVRATDSTGREQPMNVEWNRLGYGYNGISVINLQIV